MVLTNNFKRWKQPSKNSDHGVIRTRVAEARTAMQEYRIVIDQGTQATCFFFSKRVNFNYINILVYNCKKK